MLGLCENMKSNNVSFREYFPYALEFSIMLIRFFKNSNITQRKEPLNIYDIDFKFKLSK